jgi:hypothetical protein
MTNGRHKRSAASGSLAFLERKGRCSIGAAVGRWHRGKTKSVEAVAIFFGCANLGTKNMAVFSRFFVGQKNAKVQERMGPMMCVVGRWCQRDSDRGENCDKTNQPLCFVYCTTREISRRCIVDCSGQYGMVWQMSLLRPPVGGNLDNLSLFHCFYGATSCCRPT